MQNKVTSLEMYEENGKFFFKIKAKGTDKEGVWETEVPKVFTGIQLGDRLDFDMWFDHNFMSEPEKWVTLNGMKLNAMEAFDTQVNRKILYKMNLVEPIVHDMTIEEIEKKLGYKIRIVKEKEKERI